MRSIVVTEIDTCTRCGNERKVMPIFNFRPGSHSFPMLSPPITTSQVERSCGDCLTDEEVLNQLRPVMQFGLGALVRRLGDSDPDIRAALEYAQAMFTVRNNDDNDGRRAVMSVLGLE